jgi:hypothetical protein
MDLWLISVEKINLRENFTMEAKGKLVIVFPNIAIAYFAYPMQGVVLVKKVCPFARKLTRRVSNESHSHARPNRWRWYRLVA